MNSVEIESARERQAVTERILFPVLLAEGIARLYSGWSKWLELKREHDNRFKPAPPITPHLRSV